MDTLFDLEEDLIIGCRIFSKTTGYRSRLYNHKKIVYENIIELLEADKITLKNAIILLEKIIRSKMPNLFFTINSMSYEKILLEEIDFIENLLQEYYDCIDLDKATELGFPCVLEYLEDKDPWGCQIFYLTEDGKPLKTLIFNSKQEAIDWISTEGREFIPDVAERQNLLTTILKFKNGPEHSLEYLEQRN